MASLMIHLYIGEKYCQLNNITDKHDILRGSLAPDLEDKFISHFSKPYKDNDYNSAILNKVDLVSFCKTTTLDNDYIKGRFLHLITDYLFYTKYMIELPEYKKVKDKLSINEIDQLVYKDYSRVSTWMIQEFGKDINLDLLPPVGKQLTYEDMQIFSANELRNLMIYCSKLNLDKAYNEILEKNTSDVFDYKFE
jgi:hypothetical protein